MLTKLVLLLGEVYRKFKSDEVILYGASITFFMLLTLVPLMLVTLIFGSNVLEGQDVQARLVETAADIAGEQAADFTERVLGSLGGSESTTNTTILSTLVALYAASTAFAQLRKMLNKMWEAEPSLPGMRAYMLRRAVGILFLFALGAAVMIVMVASRLLAQVAQAVILPDALEGFVSIMLSDFTGFALIFIVFLAMYRILPNRKLPGWDLLVGTAVTTGLFVVGEWGLGIYFSRASHVSLYGAAGTAMVLLLWMYYSAVVVLVGAEFTYAWSRRAKLWIGSDDLTPREAAMQQLPDR